MKNPFKATATFIARSGSSLNDVGAGWVAKPLALLVSPVVFVAALFQKDSSPK